MLCPNKISNKDLLKKANAKSVEEIKQRRMRWLPPPLFIEVPVSNQVS
jgi:hypothetical protein